MLVISANYKFLIRKMVINYLIVVNERPFDFCDGLSFVLPFGYVMPVLGPQKVDVPAHPEEHQVDEYPY